MSEKVCWASPTNGRCVFVSPSHAGELILRLKTNEFKPTMSDVCSYERSPEGKVVKDYRVIFVDDDTDVEYFKSFIRKWVPSQI